MKTKLFSQIKLYASFAVLAFGLLLSATSKAVAQCPQYNLVYTGSSTRCPGEIPEISLDGSQIGNPYELYRTTNGGATWQLCSTTYGNGGNIQLNGTLSVDVGLCTWKVLDAKCVPPVEMYQRVDITGVLPTVYNLTTNPTPTCEGQSRDALHLSGSELDVRYELQNSVYGLISTTQGTGNSMDITPPFWYHGYYHVDAIDNTTGCLSIMNNSLNPVTTLGNPNTPNPSNQSNVYNLTPQLSWTSGGGQCDNWYHVTIGTNLPLTGGNVIWSTDVNTTYCTVPSGILTCWQWYAWDVHSEYSNSSYDYYAGTSTNGPWSFYTNVSCRKAENEYNTLFGENENSYIQITPNPVSDNAIINYKISEDNYVDVSIYSCHGEKITQLINEKQKPGNYKLDFSTESLTSGVYSLIFQSGMQHSTAKMIVIK
jgi:hypothetical protein